MGKFKITFFKTKNGKDWMPCEKYKGVITIPSDRAKAPKGFVKCDGFQDTFDTDESNYDFEDEIGAGYIILQGVPDFPRSHFVFPEATNVN